MTHRNNSVSKSNPSPNIQSENVLQALRHWHKDVTGPSPLANLYLFQFWQRRETGSDRHTANLILRNAMAELARVNVEYERLLCSRFLDRKSVYEVANDLNIAESTFYIRQNEAVTQLAHIILEMEERAQQERCESLLQSLLLQPPANLIGIERLLLELGPKLTANDTAMIIAIEGIGGIGKTTLADALMRAAIQQDVSWEQVAWITARQHELSMCGTIENTDGAALTIEALFEQLYEQLLPEVPRPASFDSEQVKATLIQHLTTHKCLVVIDNLETFKDIESLIPTLRQLTTPTKFILTTRKSFYAARDIFHIQIPELTEHESLELIRNKAEASNLAHVVLATDKELQPIYATVGGNPLALQLVVGQLHIHDLQEILDDLTDARTETAENLYTFIYRRAWDHLDESARRALIAMILVTDDGDTIEELLATCDLDRVALRDALKQLVTLNLANSLGGLNARRYSIHNLTRSFLHKQVVMWT